ncbi:hypothetical protein LCGC14_3042240, partial [marine sediment metagenome]
EIQDAIQNSSAVVVLLSRSSVESRWVLDEVAFALDRGIRVVPILIEECRVPLLLQRVNFVDWTPHIARSFDSQVEVAIRCLKLQSHMVANNNCVNRSGESGGI